MDNNPQKHKFDPEFEEALRLALQKPENRAKLFKAYQRIEDQIQKREREKLKNEQTSPPDQEEKAA